MTTSLTKNLGKAIVLAMLLSIAGISNAQWLGTSPNYYVPYGDNIGIGTSTPISPLQVDNTLTVGPGASANAIGTVQITTGGASPAANRLTFGTDGTGWQFRISKNQAAILTDLVTVQDNGNVGIGTTSPLYPLTVATGASQYQPAIYVLPSTYSVGGTTSYRAGILLDNWYILQDGNGNGNKDFDIYQGSSGLTRFSIGTNGNVSMGLANTAPWAPLTVNSSTPPNGAMVDLVSNSYTMLILSDICSQCYNNIAQVGDNGIIWSDGKGSSNANSGFVIAPWAGSYAGIRIAANGNIGIGNATPICPLDIGNNIEGTSGYLHVAGNISPTVSSQGGYLSWNGYNGSTGETDFINNQGGGPGGFAFYNVPQAGAVISNIAPLVFITGTGNVGIGTSSPIARFQVNATGMYNVGGVSVGSMSYTGSGNTSFYSNAYIGFNAARQSNGSWTMGSDGGSNGGMVIISDVGGGISFAPIGSGSISSGSSPQTLSSDLAVTNKIQMHFTGSGQLVIGNSIITPQNCPGNYGLYVSQGILTSQVKIALPTDAANWSDYVFANNYKLKPITEVAQYIQDNKHLPEVPSATDVQKAGIDVAGMDATLLKKIEELTLYIIDQHKEIEDLKTQLETIKKAQK